MLVISAPGTRCPKEGKPRSYITDASPVDVPDTAFYRRLVNDGSLLAASEQPAPQARSAKPTTGTRQPAAGNGGD
jgi:hypothetical protein